jgi:SPP1 family predicted phage head-tail adaptor
MNQNRIWHKSEVLGRMNQRIVIQSVTETRSTSGAVTETWATFATVWAAVTFQSGSENQLIERQTAKTFLQFIIRHRTDINEKMRISHDNKIYDIISINFEPEKQFITIVAENNK